MYRRLIEEQILDSLADTPVVLLHGARQTGKSTLVKQLAAERHPARYITLDDAGVLSAARTDPAGFLSGFEGPVILDEVQLATELFPAIKIAVDAKRTPGRFLLTGSASVFMIPRLSESLAGRMEIHTLWPLSQAEIEGTSGQFVDQLFEGTFTPIATRLDRNDLMRRLISGGYPEPISRKSNSRRRAWFRAYLTTILQRDVRDLANIEGLASLPRLLELLAARSASLLNQADLSRDSRLPYTSLSRYMALLQAIFIVHLLPSWSNNMGQCLIKSPKVLLNDTGLIAALLGLNEARLESDSRLLGQMLESFVAMELLKQASWSETLPQLFHYRTLGRQEVDLVLEDSAGRLVGIEVKASATVTASDFRGLHALAEAVGPRFLHGLVVYVGEQSIPFGKNLFTLPVSALWRV